MATIAAPPTRSTVVPVDLGAARAALAELTPRTAALIAAIDDSGRPTAGLNWTLGETAAHLVVALRAYTASVRGDLSAWTGYMPDTEVYRDRLAAVTSATLASVDSRDPGVLSGELVEAADAFLTAGAGHSPEEAVATPWYGTGTSIPLGAATCLLLGEQLMHGRDLARSAGTPWTITRAQALLLMPVFEAMMPVVVDAAAAGEVRAVYALHVRGAGTIVLRVDGGRATVEPRAGQRIDCHLTADPVSLVLVCYGRINQWRAITRGGLVAWGRRPWLGLRMKGLFFNP